MTTNIKSMIDIIHAQSERCRKPHFSGKNYSGRVEIEAWNNGVSALERELIKVLMEEPQALLCLIKQVKNTPITPTVIGVDVHLTFEQMKEQQEIVKAVLGEQTQRT